MLTMQSCLKVNAADIAAKVIDGEAILINISNGLYHSLDSAGAAIWELIQGGHSLEQISGCVAGQYDAPLATIQVDIERLAGELLQQNLVVLSTEPAPRLDVKPCASKRPYEALTLHTYDDMSDLLALDPPMPGVQDISKRR